MLYFAYGSNLELGQILRRCPAIKPVAPALLDDWELVFRGVADVVPSEGCYVRGALYEITSACEAALDSYEGFRAADPRRGMYRKEFVRVRDSRGRFQRAMLYRMNSDHRAAPSEFYLDIIIEGCHDWGLPTRKLLRAAGRVRLEAAAV